MPRIKNTLRNSFFAVAAQLLLTVISFVTRSLFIRYLSVEYLGLEGLFSNIFSFLNLAELGIGGVIVFHLYKPLAEENQEEMGRLMRVYQLVYRTLGSSIFVVGFVLMFFVQHLVDLPTQELSFVRAVYLLQLFGTVSTYFFAYNRSLFLADQKDYLCIGIDTAMNLVFSLLKIVSLVLFQNYFVYLILNIARVWCSNLYVTALCKKQYPFLKKKATLPKGYLKEKQLFQSTRIVIFHNLAGFVYGATDNIVISAFLGIRMVGLMANYYIIIGTVQTLVDKITSSVQASMGDLVYRENDPQKTMEVFNALQLCCFLISSFCVTAFIGLTQSFIVLWLNEAFLLSVWVVILMSANFYVSVIHRPVYQIYAVCGLFRKDKYSPIVAAALNLLLSICLIQVIGVTGVLWGTVISHFVYWGARTYVVYKYYFKSSPLRHICKQLAYALITAGEAATTVVLCSALFPSNTVLSFLGKMAVVIFVPNIINLLLFCRTDAFKHLWRIAFKLLHRA